MAQRTWLITGVSSGFGRQLTERLLDGGERVVGTVRGLDKVADLVDQYPAAFRAELLDVTDAAAIRQVVDRSFAELGRIDVIVSNAGYGLFGATEELSDEQIRHIVDTNLIGSIQLIRAALPHLRRQGGGRIIFHRLRQPLQHVGVGAAGMWRAVDLQGVQEGIDRGPDGQPAGLLLRGSGCSSQRVSGWT